MKKPKGGFWKIAASCVVAASLVFGISALPAFAGEDAAGTDCSRSEEESAAEEETEHDWLIPGEGVTIVDDAEEEEGDANPFTKLPDVVFGETVNMFGNVMGSQYRAKSNVLRTYSDDSDDSESEAPNPIVMDRPVDDMSISVYKRWYEDTAQTRPSEITVEIFGYTLEEGQEKPANGELPAGFEDTYIDKNDKMVYFDANDDGKGSLEEPDELDTYFDMNADGQIGAFEYTTKNDQGEDVQVTFDERASETSTSEGGLDNRIVAPYYYDKVTLKGDSENAVWRFNIDNTLPRYFYEYTSPTDVTSTDEDGNEVTETYSSCVPVIDKETLQPKTREFHYVVRETPVDGYETSYDALGPGSVSSEGEVTSFKNDDGKDYIAEVGIKNTKIQPGSLMITKHFSDSIWVGEKAEGQTANENVTVVFHVEAVEVDDEGKVDESVDPISYGYYGMTFTADDGADDTQPIVVNNLPVGKWYRVTEINYPGSGYVIAGGANASQVIKKLVDANEVIEFAFENVRPDGAGDTPNSGIVNTYKQNTDGSGYTVTSNKSTN